MSKHTWDPLIDCIDLSCYVPPPANKTHHNSHKLDDKIIEFTSVTDKTSTPIMPMLGFYSITNTPEDTLVAVHSMKTSHVSFQGITIMSTVDNFMFTSTTVQATTAIVPMFGFSSVRNNSEDTIAAIPVVMTILKATIPPSSDITKHHENKNKFSIYNESSDKQSVAKHVVLKKKFNINDDNDDDNDEWLPSSLTKLLTTSHLSSLFESKSSIVAPTSLSMLSKSLAATKSSNSTNLFKKKSFIIATTNLSMLSKLLAATKSSNLTKLHSTTKSSILTKSSVANVVVELTKKEMYIKKKLILEELLSKIDQFEAELVVDREFGTKQWKNIFSQMKELGDSLTQQLLLSTTDEVSRCWREYCLTKAQSKLGYGIIRQVVGGKAVGEISLFGFRTAIEKACRDNYTPTLLFSEDA